MNKKRDISIQLIRIVAMLMIFTDHTIIVLDFPLKSVIVQMANSGVFIFLFISAFLFGRKEVTNWKLWFKKRLLRVCVPMWIFMAIDFLLEAIIWHEFHIKFIFIYLFNLQGILGINIGGMNLWFLTLLMICYLITPFLQYIKQRIRQKTFVCGMIALIILQVLLAYITDIGMVIEHTFSWCILAVGVYIVGYFIGDKICNNDIGAKRIIILTMLLIMSCSIILLGKRYLDGQIIYDRIIIFYGIIVVDWWIVTILYKIGSFIKFKAIFKLINHFDSISYEIYIVNGLLIHMVTLPLLNRIGNIPYLLLTITLSYIMAWMLHGTCKMVYKITGIEKNKNC